MRTPAFVFDLDGTLVDSVYQHVLAWREALEEAGIDLAVWRIHRRIGMSGGLLVNALGRETGRRLTDDEVAHLQSRHASAYARQAGTVRPLPGACELLDYLSRASVLWAIATSGRLAPARPALELLSLPADAVVVTRDVVERAKPDPDLFVTAAQQLGVDVTAAVVVGDSVWDLLAAHRARARRRAALRRVRTGRARAGWRVSGVSGSRRSVASPGRGWRPDLRMS
jgi:HAD superfamily hydrolase (TIGR01509 family)